MSDQRKANGEISLFAFMSPFLGIGGAGLLAGSSAIPHLLISLPMASIGILLLLAAAVGAFFGWAMVWSAIEEMCNQAVERAEREKTA